MLLQATAYLTYTAFASASSGADVMTPWAMVLSNSTFQTTHHDDWEFRGLVLHVQCSVNQLVSFDAIFIENFLQHQF